jgi:hypothetical protein
MIGPILAYLFSNEKIPDFGDLLLARLFLTSRPDSPATAIRLWHSQESDLLPKLLVKWQEGGLLREGVTP